MKFKCQKEQQSCINFCKESDTPIEYIKTTKNATNQFLPAQSKILILLEGRITFSFGMFYDCPMVEKQILYLLPDYQFTYFTNEDSKIIIIHLSSKIQFCEHFNIEMLAHSSASILRNIELKAIANSPYLLNMNEPIFEFARGLTSCYEFGVRCKEYFECKEKELFCLFKLFYSKEELYLFFEKALTPDTSFSYFIQQNYYKYQTLSEMAVAMNMTLSGLEKRFKKVFKTSGYRWMNDHRAKKIHHAICTEDTPLKEISMRFGFSSQSTFNDFCKKRLGFTPGQIRKNTNG